MPAIRVGRLGRSYRILFVAMNFLAAPVHLSFELLADGFGLSVFNSVLYIQHVINSVVICSGTSRSSLFLFALILAKNMIFICAYWQYTA